MAEWLDAVAFGPLFGGGAVHNESDLAVHEGRTEYAACRWQSTVAGLSLQPHTVTMYAWLHGEPRASHFFATQAFRIAGQSAKQTTRAHSQASRPLGSVRCALRAEAGPPISRGDVARRQ